MIVAAQCICQTSSPYCGDCPSLPLYPGCTSMDPCFLRVTRLMPTASPVRLMPWNGTLSNGSNVLVESKKYGFEFRTPPVCT